MFEQYVSEPQDLRQTLRSSGQALFGPTSDAGNGMAFRV